MKQPANRFREKAVRQLLRCDGLEDFVTAIRSLTPDAEPLQVIEERFSNSSKSEHDGWAWISDLGNEHDLVWAELAGAIAVMDRSVAASNERLESVERELTKVLPSDSFVWVHLRVQQTIAATRAQTS